MRDLHWYEIAICALAILVIAPMFALALDYAVTLVENHLLRWRPTGGETVKAAG